ncbi:hypothetical protein [Francisella adeliensis]|uniref:Uncharacterized protein n=1 Tax=Francisella adeliensis TaxID=2007306 RepID=A0A2Z4XYR5_9GAMM|nr:hypothetical protein [Francisella adeliensis]AXA33575.1 hypothetical protein CDH04_03740 [Francisella adeliensis]MBK2084717.1 hypothetical protein [Francisella adeliensis]MBK2097340.1 hypothetical protein [Francisella adeliensis]QIW11807.1 hypothetical protein FZC43_03740 [Francisella adeliensis]QIW13683.1 hypothetical protein FZC44_03740 [Francisella adeliensis]
MKKIISIMTAVFLVHGVFAEKVYETDADGVASFSNNKTKGAKIVNLNPDSVTVFSAATELKNEPSYLNKSASYYKRPYGYSDTLQGSFPEQLTDNYFDFYGRNHHYESLMSSTHNSGFYDSKGANNNRLRNNY